MSEQQDPRQMTGEARAGVIATFTTGSILMGVGVARAIQLGEDYDIPSLFLLMFAIQLLTAACVIFVLGRK